MGGASVTPDTARVADAARNARLEYVLPRHALPIRLERESSTGLDAQTRVVGDEHVGPVIFQREPLIHMYGSAGQRHVRGGTPDLTPCGRADGSFGELSLEKWIAETRSVAVGQGVLAKPHAVTSRPRRVSRPTWR